MSGMSCFQGSFPTAPCQFPCCSTHLSLPHSYRHVLWLCSQSHEWNVACHDAMEPGGHTSVWSLVSQCRYVSMELDWEGGERDCIPGSRGLHKQLCVSKGCCILGRLFTQSAFVCVFHLLTVL